MPTTDKPGTTPSARNGSSPPPDARSVTEQLRLFLILLAGLILVTQLELPFRLAGIALALVGVWLGVRLLVRMSRLRKTGVRTRGVVIVPIGIGIFAFVMLTLASEAIAYPVAADYQRCLSEANTQTARNACEDAMQDRFQQLIDRLSREARENS